MLWLGFGSPTMYQLTLCTCNCCRPRCWWSRARHSWANSVATAARPWMRHAGGRHQLWWTTLKLMWVDQLLAGRGVALCLRLSSSAAISQPAAVHGPCPAKCGGVMGGCRPDQVARWGVPKQHVEKPTRAASAASSRSSGTPEAHRGFRVGRLAKPAASKMAALLGAPFA
jgi:hypothetical protein